MQRPDHVKHLWEDRTWLTIMDTTMDPPTVDVIVDGKLDWHYFDGEVHEAVRADHPPHPADDRRDRARQRRPGSRLS